MRCFELEEKPKSLQQARSHQPQTVDEGLSAEAP